MSNFYYKATNERGEPVEGYVSAPSVRMALIQLERMGLAVETIGRQEVELDSVDTDSADTRNQIRERRNQALQNARLWSAPLHALAKEIGSDWISQALRLTSQRLAEVNRIDDLCADAETAQVFPFVVHELDSNPLSQSWLERMAKDIRAKQQFRRDMLIPLITLAFFFIIMVMGAVWIIPVFKEMFDDFGLSLAPPTKLLFTISGWIYPHYLRSLAVLAVVAFIIGILWRSNQRFGWLQRFMPWFTAGSRSSLRSMGQFIQNLAELRRLGYPVPQAMLMAVQSCPNIYLKSKVMSFVDGVFAGQQPDIQQLRVLPASLLALLFTEQDNADALHDLGRLYCDRERDNSGKLPLLLSHLIILGVGFVVTFSIIALFMPQVRMITSLA